MKLLLDSHTYHQLGFPDPQHRNPFDRMIIAQSLQGQLLIVGQDAAFDAYGVQRIW